MDENTTASRHTCLKLDLVGDDPKTKDAIFVKGTWLASHFQLSVTDGLHAWCCQASEVEVAKRAAQWDQSVEEYIEMAERYLGFQQPGSVYRFEDVENGSRRDGVEGRPCRRRTQCRKSCRQRLGMSMPELVEGGDDVESWMVRKLLMTCETSDDLEETCIR